MSAREDDGEPLGAGFPENLRRCPVCGGLLPPPASPFPPAAGRFSDGWARSFSEDWARLFDTSCSRESAVLVDEDDGPDFSPSVTRGRGVALVAPDALHRTCRVARGCLLVARLIGRGARQVAVHASDVGAGRRVGRHFAGGPHDVGAGRRGLRALQARRVAAVERGLPVGGVR